MERDLVISPPEHPERVTLLPCSTAAAVPSEHGRLEPCLSQMFFPIL